MTSTTLDSAREEFAFGAFRKRTLTFDALVGNLAEMWRRRADAWAIWRDGRLDRALRERIMMAVARVNECRYCTFVHESWAADAGVSAEDLQRIADFDLGDVDARTASALAYARALAEADFGAVPATTAAALADHVDVRERSDVVLVARAMSIANRSANTLDALLSRLRGRPSPGGRLLDELAVSSIVAIVLLCVAPLAMRHRRSSPARLLRDFRRFSSEFEPSGRGS